MKHSYRNSVTAMIWMGVVSALLSTAPVSNAFEQDENYYKDEMAALAQARSQLELVLTAPADGTGCYNIQGELPLDCVKGKLSAAIGALNKYPDLQGLANELKSTKIPMGWNAVDFKGINAIINDKEDKIDKSLAPPIQQKLNDFSKLKQGDQLKGQSPQTAQKLSQAYTEMKAGRQKRDQARAALQAYQLQASKENAARCAPTMLNMSGSDPLKGLSDFLSQMPAQPIVTGPAPKTGSAPILLEDSDIEEGGSFSYDPPKN
jgi:hypothetical protein